MLETFIFFISCHIVLDNMMVSLGNYIVIIIFTVYTVINDKVNSFLYTFSNKNVEVVLFGK